MSNKTVDSAIVILLPMKLCKQIQSYREKIDLDYPIWPAHIPLIYPFLPESEFLNLLGKLNEAMSSVAPFKVTLDKVASYSHNNSVTLYFKPKIQPQDALIQLQKILVSLYPNCNETSLQFPKGYLPRVPIGQVTKSNLAVVSHIIKSDFKSVEWEVKEISLISRDGNQPFTCKNVVTLSGIPKAAKNKGLQVADPNAKIESLREKAPPLNFNPNDHLSKITRRFQKWRQMPSKSPHLPKTKEALAQSLKPLCLVKMQALPTSYIYKKLIEANYVEEDNGVPILVDRKFTRFPALHEDNLHYTHNLKPVQKAALSKAFSWVTTAEFSPTTKESFEKTLKQLSYENCQVDPEYVVKYLVQRKIISLDEEQKVTYHNANSQK